MNKDLLGNNLKITDKVEIEHKGIIYTGEVSSAYYDKYEHAWSIECINPYRNWKQQSDGGELKSINGKPVKTIETMTKTELQELKDWSKIYPNISSKNRLSKLMTEVDNMLENKNEIQRYNLVVTAKNTFNVNESGLTDLDQIGKVVHVQDGKAVVEILNGIENGYIREYNVKDLEPIERIQLHDCITCNARDTINLKMQDGDEIYNADSQLFNKAIEIAKRDPERYSFLAFTTKDGRPFDLTLTHLTGKVASEQDITFNVHGTPSKCSYYMNNNLLVLSHNERSSGTSITNALEKLVIELSKHNGKDPNNITIVEHYAKRNDMHKHIGDEYSLVEFHNNTPLWSRITEKEYRAVERQAKDFPNFTYKNAKAMIDKERQRQVAKGNEVQPKPVVKKKSIQR